MSTFSLAAFIFLVVPIFCADNVNYEIDLGRKKMRVCDNLIVRDIPGNFSTVLRDGLLYNESMANVTRDGRTINYIFVFELMRYIYTFL